MWTIWCELFVINNTFRFTEKTKYELLKDARRNSSGIGLDVSQEFFSNLNRWIGDFSSGFINVIYLNPLKELVQYEIQSK